MTLWQREPAVLRGFLGSLIVLFSKVVTGDLTWQNAVLNAIEILAPVIAGALIRPSVTPVNGTS